MFRRDMEKYLWMEGEIDMKDTEPLVSIIIPVYNAERYLSICLESVLDQIYKKFELILIDDGAQDSSGAICDRFAEKDERVVVYHNENGGAAAARNFGLDHAIGEYVCFVDADDYVGSNYLLSLVKMVKRYNVEIAGIRCMVVPGENGQFGIDNHADDFPVQLMDKEEALKEVLLGRGKLGVAPWGRIFHRKLWDEIRYPTGVLYEDLLTLPYVFARCNRITLGDTVQYYYRQTPFSLTHRPITPRDRDLFDNVSLIMNYIDTSFPQLHDAALARMMKEHICYLYRAVYLDDYAITIRQIRKENRKYWLESLGCRYVPVNQKMQFLILLINIRLYQVCRKLINFIKMSDPGRITNRE